MVSHKYLHTTVLSLVHNRSNWVGILKTISYYSIYFDWKTVNRLEKNKIKNRLYLLKYF